MAKLRFPAGFWLSFQPGARGGNSWLTTEKRADPARPGAGDPVRSLASREHRHLFTGSSTKTRCFSKETVKEDTQKGNSTLCFSGSKRRHFSHFTISENWGVPYRSGWPGAPEGVLKPSISLVWVSVAWKTVLETIQEYSSSPPGTRWLWVQGKQTCSAAFFLWEWKVGSANGKWGALHDGEPVGGPAPGAISPPMDSWKKRAS